MRWLLLALAGLGLVIVGLIVLWHLWVMTAEPRVVLHSPLVPAGDTVHPHVIQSRHWGNELFGGEEFRNSTDFPRFLRRVLYHWQLEPPGQELAPGAASLDGDGVVIGQKPGYVRLRVSVLWVTHSVQLRILPRVADYRATPPDLHLKIDEKQTLTFTAQLEGGKAPSDWYPLLWFPMPNLPAGRYGGSPFARAGVAPAHSMPGEAEWSFDIVGTAPGSTSIYLEIGNRELIVPLTVASDTFRPDLHAAGLPHDLLGKAGYAWQTRAFAYGHLHFLPGSHAERTAAALEQLVDTARAYTLTWLMIDDRQPLELFFVDTRAQMQALVGRPTDAVHDGANRGALFFYDSTFHPFLVRELTQLYAEHEWGPPRNGRWISEGLGMLMGGLCQGATIEELGKGLIEDGKALDWTHVQRDYDAIDEMTARLNAASMVNFVKYQLGIPAVRQLWVSEGWDVLQRHWARDITQTEAAWRRRQEDAYHSARLDPVKWEREGCPPAR